MKAWHLRSVRSAIAVLLIPLLGACAYQKEYAPISTHATAMRIPNQQRMLALAATQAVQQASRNLNLPRYRGITVRVEVNGVLPHSDTDLLDYVATAVEAEAARAGASVLPRVPRLVVPGVTGEIPGRAEPAPDVRLVASVDWGGVDYKDEKLVRGGTLAGQIIVGVIPSVVGAAVAASSVNNGNNPNTSTLIMAGSILAGLGWIPALVWGLADPPYNHQFTLLGRVHITLRGIPMKAYGTTAVLAEGVGEGASSIVIDPSSETGYSLLLDVPFTKPE